MILGSSSYEELATRTDYLAQIEESDAALAARVEQVRDQVAASCERVARLKAKADAYDERLAAARARKSRRCAAKPNRPPRELRVGRRRQDGLARRR